MIQQSLNVEPPATTPAVASLDRCVTQYEPRVVCSRCGCDRFVEIPIHKGHSRRADCTRCGFTLGFPLWYGRVVTMEQWPPHTARPSQKSSPK